MADETVLLPGVLDDDQLDLIHTIARPWTSAHLDDSYGWPTWDFVRRRFEANHGGRSALSVLSSLPSIVGPIVSGGSYGLWWQTSPHSGLVDPAARLGLTIAGLTHLDRGRASYDEVPDLAAVCVDLVAEAAQRESELPLDSWWDVPSGSFDLRTWFRSAPSPPVEIVGQVLLHEFQPLAVNVGDHEYTIEYGRGRFADFRFVANPDDYVALASGRAGGTPEADGRPPSPLSLPAAMDYLGLAVRSHPEWPKGVRLVNLPTFEAAASVLSEPISQAEFDARCSNLWNILGRLGTPPPEPADNPDNLADRPLNNLKVWTRKHLHSGYEGGCDNAIGDLQAIGLIRQGAQHASGSTHARQLMAHRRLGLPDLITNWAAAWTTVLDAAASAFHTLTVAVRASEPPETR